MMSRHFLRMIFVAVPLVLTASGCCLNRKNGDLTSAQLHARELYAENQRLQQEWAQANQALQGLSSENQALLSQLADTQGEMATMNERLNNFAAERDGLANRYAQALDVGVGVDVDVDEGGREGGTTEESPRESPLEAEAKPLTRQPLALSENKD